MTFAQAKKQLAKLANGKYHVIKFELTEYQKDCQDVCGRGVANCSLYIDGHQHHKGKTWEEAFMSLDRAINPPSESEVMAMAPKGEVTA